jgi:RNA polymerase sigma factor (sigma-70 family)
LSEVLNDLELIRRCAHEGDAQAWETFVKTYSLVIWSSAQKTFRTHFSPCLQEDVEDIFNSVFLALIENDFNKLRQYRGENSCSLRTWLAVVTARMTIDYMRRDGRHLQAGALQDGTDILEIIPDRGPSPQTEGETVTLTAASTGYTNPQYRFLLWSPIPAPIPRCRATAQTTHGTTGSRRRPRLTTYRCRCVGREVLLPIMSLRQSNSLCSEH